jgi:O-antigen/teichoic acid export membrane protein
MRPALTNAHAQHVTHGLSGAGIALAAVAAAIALLCVLWAVSRALTFEPRWTLSLRHALAEAGFRASATWAEFRDWARLGR